MSVDFSDGANAGLTVDVLSTAGQPLYQLECRTFRYTSVTFNYSGDFECTLTDPREVAVNHHATLLADASSVREWDTRGRFLREEVEGECADYPEYGRLRHFRLRGMELTLRLDNIVFRPADSSEARAGGELPAFESFRFEVQIRSDSTATSETAELPAVRNPLQREPNTEAWKRDCSMVLPRRSPNPQE